MGLRLKIEQQSEVCEGSAPPLKIFLDPLLVRGGWAAAVPLPAGYFANAQRYRADQRRVPRGGAGVVSGSLPRPVRLVRGATGAVTDAYMRSALDYFETNPHACMDTAVLRVMDLCFFFEN